MEQTSHHRNFSMCTSACVNAEQARMTSWPFMFSAFRVGHGSGTADARGPFGFGYLRGLLAGWQAGSVGIAR